MATFDKRLRIYDKAFISTEGLGTYFFDFLHKAISDAIKSRYFKSGIFSGGDILLNEADTITISSLHGVSSVGRFINYPQSSFKFENSFGITYYIGCKFCEIVDTVAINPITGRPEYIYYQEQVGEVGNCDAVYYLPGDKLLIVVDSVLESNMDNSGRIVRVWLKEPVTSDPGWFEECEVVYGDVGGATVNYIVTNGLLGQLPSSVSLNKEDYIVWAKGYTISKVRNFSDEAAYPEYICIGSVVGAGKGNIPSSYDQSCRFFYGWVDPSVEVIWCRAGEDILNGDAVAIGTNPSEIIKANSSLPERMPAIGVADANIPAGKWGPVIVHGKKRLDYWPGGFEPRLLDEGVDIWVSPLINGVLTSSRPSSPGTISQALAIVSDAPANEIFVNPGLDSTSEEDFIRYFIGKYNTGHIEPEYDSNFVIADGDNHHVAITKLDRYLSIADSISKVTLDYVNTFGPSVSWTVGHNLGSRELIVECWDDTGDMVNPYRVKILSDNVIAIYWNDFSIEPRLNSVAGKVVVHAVRKSTNVFEFPPSPYWEVIHNLNSINLILECWSQDNSMIIPFRVVINSPNSLTIWWNDPDILPYPNNVGGRVVIYKV